MPKSNVDWNIEVLVQIAQITKETIENKEHTIKETNAKKEEILTNVNAEIEKLKSRLEECQQQFKKTFLKTHDENDEKLKQCVIDLRQYLLTVQNGDALLSAVQQNGSAKQKFIIAMKIINEVEEGFKQFKAMYSEDEEIQYEHDHTAILKQVCNQDKIEDVTMEARPSGTIWKLSMHLPSFRVLDNIEHQELSKFFKNLSNPNSLKVENKSEFEISGTAHQAVFVNSDTFIIATSSPISLKAAKTDGTMKSFEYPIELKGKPCLSKSITRNVIYVGCLARIFKLKITERKTNEVTASCFAGINVKEDFEGFCVDEKLNKIVVATNTKITIFTLSPFLQIQTTTVQSSGTFVLLSMSVIQDRIALVRGNEVACFSVSGKELFRYQVGTPQAAEITCVTFDPFSNLYVVYSKRRQVCHISQFPVSIPVGYPVPNYDLCEYCGYNVEAHNDIGGVYQIFSDGCNGRYFIPNVPKLFKFLLFNDFSKECVISDGSRYSVYRLLM